MALILNEGCSIFRNLLRYLRWLIIVLMRAISLTLATICFVSCCFAQQRQRLVAQADYVDTIFTSGLHDNLILRDSAHLVYSGARHSDFDYNMMDYLGLYEPFLYQSPLVARINSIVVPNNVDSSSYALRVQFDSLLYFDCWNKPLPQLFAIETAKFWPDGKCAETYQDVQGYGNATQFIYYFDRLIKRKNAQAQPGSIVDSNIQFYVYDAFRNAVIDSSINIRSGVTKTNLVTLYTFDDSGHYLTRTTPPTRFDYSYNPDGRVASIVTEVSGPGGPFFPSYVDSVKYTPGVPGYTSYNTYYYSNGIPNSFTSRSRTFRMNAFGRKDTLIDDRGNYKNIIYLTYGSNGLPEVRTVEIYISGVWNQRVRTFYHYEDYDPNLRVAINQGQTPIALFPNPASGTITLQGLPKSTISVCISNMLGQLVHSEAFVPQGSSANVTLGDEVAPGVYSICVQGQGGAPLYKGVFVKR